MGAGGGGGGVGSRNNRGNGLLDTEVTLELLGETVNLSIALASVEELGLVDGSDRVGQVSTTTKELVLGDGLVVGRLVNDGSLVSDDVGRDGGLDTVVLVSVLLDDGLDNVVDVVVDVLLDTLTLVDDLTVEGSLSVSIGVLASNRGKESSVLVGGGVGLVHLGDGVDLSVELLSRVLRVENGLSVVLDVVDVAVVVLLTDNLLDLMTLVSAVSDGGKVLNVLLNLTVVQVEVLVRGDMVAVLVRDGAVLGVDIGRSAKTVLDLVSDLLTGGAVVVVSGGSGTSGGSSASGSSTNGAELLGAGLGRTRVGGGGGRRRETAVVRRVVTGVRSARKNLLNRVHGEGGEESELLLLSWTVRVCAVSGRILRSLMV